MVEPSSHKAASAPSNLIPLLERALRSKLGVRVTSQDGETLRRKLYVLRKQNSRFGELSFKFSPHDPNEIWIVRKL